MNKGIKSSAAGFANQVVSSPECSDNISRYPDQKKGIGVPKKYIRNIFNPYFTTKQKGSGLGLATSYFIIKRQVGHIEVNSDPGFTVAGTMDYICPWKSCYRSARHVGSGKNVFVLSHSGHMQCILNLSGNPKSAYYKNDTILEDPDQWMKNAGMKKNSWWEYWTEISLMNLLNPHAASFDAEAAEDCSGYIPLSGDFPCCKY